MKGFIATLLMFSFQSFGQSEDYTCHIRNYRIDLQLYQDSSTHFWLTDTMYHDTLAHGYAKFIEKKGEKVTYHFYPGNAEPVKMTFNYQDTVNLPQNLQMYIETKARGFLLWEKVRCNRR